MYNSLKTMTSKILAGILALLMLISIISAGTLVTALAVTVDRYTVTLMDGADVTDLDGVEVTLKNKSDINKFSSQVTVNGIAVFENFVEEGETYFVSVSEKTGYESISDFEITPAADETNTNISLTAIDKITINGVINDENGNPYEGAKVNLSGYVTAETTTNAAGKYSFEAYKGKNYTVKATAKEDKYETVSTNIVNPAADYTCDVLTFAVKSFTITTTSDDNGTITTTDTVFYGKTKIIEVKAKDGYCINSFKVDGTEQSEATAKKEYTYTFSNITANHRVDVTFKRQTYKIAFTVNENGYVEYTNGTKQKVEGGSVNINKEFNESEDPYNPTKVMVEAIPNNNYRVSKVVIDGNEETFTDNNGKGFETVFTMTKDHTFVVEFKLNQYKVKINSGENGTATVDNEEVEWNGSAKVTIVPDKAYQISKLKVNGSDVEEQESDISGTLTYYIDILNIKEDKVIDIEYVKTPETNESGKIETDKYKVIFTYGDKEYTPVVNGNKYIVPNDVKVKIEPKSPYKHTSINKATMTQKNIYLYDKEITANTEINNIYVFKSDKVRPYESIIANIEIVYDSKAPEISNIKKDPEKEYNNKEYIISANVTDDIAGVDKVYYSKTNDFSTAEQASYDVSANVATFKTVNSEYNDNYYIWATDKVGNITESKKLSIAIDITKPTVDKFEFSSPSLNECQFGTFSHEDIQVLISASDEKSDTTNSGIASITFNGQTVESKDFKNGKAEFVLSSADFKETKEVSAIATDNAGNVSEVVIPTTENSNVKSNKITISDTMATVVTQRKNEAIYVDDDNCCWYSGNTDFVVTVTDDFGIKSVLIKMNGKEVVNETCDTEALTVNSKEYTINTSENPRDGRNEITVEVINVTNNKSDNSESDSKTVYIDTTAPDITEFKIERVGGSALDKVLNFLTFGVFFNDNVEVTIMSNDENATSGIKDITLYADGIELETKNVENDKCTFTVPLSAVTDKKLHFNKVLSAKAKDNVNNITARDVEPTTVNSDIKNSKLMIETVEPTVNVLFPEAKNKQNLKTQKSDEEWYNSDVEFTVIPSDVDSGLRNVLITINDKELVNENLSLTEVHTKEYKVNTKDSNINKDGSYTIKVVVTDNAGNVNIENSYSKTIFKDTDKPYITGFDFKPEKYIEGSETKSTVEVTNYGFYFKENTKVTISARDDYPTAGIKGITYYTVDKNAGKSAETFAKVNKDGNIQFVIEKDFKGQIYARAIDNVDNTQNTFVNPNSAIIEKKDTHNKEEHIRFKKEDTSCIAKDGTDLYSKDVPVTLIVTDSYSGIRKIEWEVVAPYDTVNNQSGKVIVNNDKSYSEDSDKDWKSTKTEVNLVTEMKKTITVNNNSNDIVVRVKMTDRAGNTSEKSIEFCIDKTKPEIEVTYDNNTPDEIYKDIYKANRTATIKISERNFNGKDVIYKIKNTDGVIPQLNGWKEHKNDENPDETYYIASIAYTADGDYTFDISYSDLAQNSTDKFTQNTFTIDKTIPTVNVSYDNNSALNGNYYKADRTATITIVEHNFDEARVNVIGTATDNGTTMIFPAASTWNTNGDVHIATINYFSDSKYTFDIEFLDMAGNSIKDYALEEFYVDKTAPTLEISGVEDKSANNGTVAPVITYTDTNFNKDNVTIELSGVINKKVNYAASIEEVENGQRVTYADFEKIKKVDDIYTLTTKLTDMAGNETTKSIMFSANRFGSVYTFDSSLEAIEGKYISTERNIIFTETNVDKLDRESINVKLAKNGTPSDLEEGTDYIIEATGGNGQWRQYKYIVNKSLFEGDGNYRLTVYSKDAAGNVNENIEESKKAEISFGIDKTNPVIVPVDFESGKQYPVELKTVKAEIKDNLVLDNAKIYLNDKEIEYSVSGETYTFDVPEANEKQNVKFVASDAAENRYELSVEDFLVSTNIFVRWYNNTPLFIGSIIGVVVVGIGLTALIIFRKKKKKEDK